MGVVGGRGHSLAEGHRRKRRAASCVLGTSSSLGVEVPCAIHPVLRGTRWRSPEVSPAVFLAHPPDLQSRPLMDMDFATSCPLVRPVLPRIRLLFVRSRFRSTLPSDGPSRFRPCASLVLHLHQVAQGTFTPRLLDMPSTQDKACCCTRACGPP